jgi:hypothetical protein
MSNDFNDDDERQLPVFDSAKLSNEYRNGKTRQQTPPRMPSRAIALKAAELRAAIRHGNAPDWADLNDRFADLWQEARQVIWRAKHSKAGTKVWNEAEQRDVLTFVADEKQVLAAIDTTRGILDSLVKLRRGMGPETTGIPRWAIERIERALRNHPEALNALLKELAAEGEKQAEVE